MEKFGPMPCISTISIILRLFVNKDVISWSFITFWGKLYYYLIKFKKIKMIAFVVCLSCLTTCIKTRISNLFLLTKEWRMRSQAWRSWTTICSNSDQIAKQVEQLETKEKLIWESLKKTSTNTSSTSSVYSMVLKVNLNRSNFETLSVIAFY
jgi:hypothetical protein